MLAEYMCIPGGTQLAVRARVAGDAVAADAPVGMKARCALWRWSVLPVQIAAVRYLEPPPSRASKGCSDYTGGASRKRGHVERYRRIIARAAVESDIAARGHGRVAACNTAVRTVFVLFGFILKYIIIVLKGCGACDHSLAPRRAY